MPLPDGIICRTRPKKDGTKYTNCYGGVDTKKKTKKKSNNNIMPNIDDEIASLMKIDDRKTRRKQRMPKKNAKTVPQQIARKELQRGRSFQADRARAELVGKPMTPAPKAGKVVLKRNVRAGAEGDVRAKPKKEEPPKQRKRTKILPGSMKIFDKMVQMFDARELDVSKLNKRDMMFVITMKKPFGGRAPNYFVDANSQYRVSGRANYIAGEKGKKAETGSLLIYTKGANKNHKGFVDGRKKGDPGMTLSMKNLKKMIEDKNATLKEEKNIPQKEWINME